MGERASDKARGGGLAGPRATARAQVGAVLIAVSCGVGEARAQDTEPRSEAVVVTYAAPGECPTELAFSERVSARVGALRPPAPGEVPRRFGVTISQSVSSSFTGQLRIVNVDGRVAERRLSAADCEELSTALALVVALAIDPRAANAETEPSGAEPGGAEGGSPSSATSAAATPPVEPEPARAVSPPPASVPSTRNATNIADTSSAATAAPGTFTEVGLGVDGRVIGGVAPEALFALGAYGQIDWRARHVVGPTLRLGVDFAPERTLQFSQGVAHFSWFGAEVSACPVRWVVGDVFRARPCAGIEVGAVFASGSQTTNARSAARLWVAPRLDAEIELRPVTHLALQGFGGVHFPTFQDEFVIGEERVHTVPNVSWLVGLRLGSYF